MKIAYFDCFSGISGDMILGALVDAGVDGEALQAELLKLKLQDYSLNFTKSIKHGITGIKANVKILEEAESHHHKHAADEHNGEHAGAIHEAEGCVSRHEAISEAILAERSEHTHD